MKPDLYRDVLVTTSLAPDTYADDQTVTGTTVDMYAGGARYRSAMAVVVHGTITATYAGTVTLQHSDDGSSWSNATTDGTFFAVATAQSEKVKAVGYKGGKRYLRLVLTAEAAADQTADLTGLILVAPAGRVPITQP